jgi:exopolysaccharide biosynthesis polyprenyl glycosylphosphotransferase
VWVIVFAFLGLYAMRLKYTRTSEWVKVFLGSTSAVALFIFVIFFRQELFASRFIILVTWILTTLYVVFGRSIVRGIQRIMIHRGIGAHNLVLFTSAEDKHNLQETFRKHPEFGYFVREHFVEFSEDAKRKILELDNTGKLDDILLADPHVNTNMLLDLEGFCSENHINFMYTADLFPIPLAHFQIGTLAGVPTIEITRTKLDGWAKVWKRMYDIIGSALLLILLSPVFLIVAILVTLDSKGKVFYASARVGERGKIFSLYKFRSMVEKAEQMKDELLKFNERQDGPLFKMTNDPRITRFGRFIRKTSLDEFPQLVNVLRGDMSLVGPRPHEPREVAQYSHSQKKLLTIKPGMTGLAQVSGRSDLRFDQEAQLDIYYIENWSMGMDMAILLKTPAVVLFKKAV